MFRRKKNSKNIAHVDVDRDVGQMFFVREYSKITNEDRTVAVYVNLRSAERAIHVIRQNKTVSKDKDFEIEVFDYVEHKNSLVAK